MSGPSSDCGSDPGDLHLDLVECDWIARCGFLPEEEPAVVPLEVPMCLLEQVLHELDLPSVEEECLNSRIAATERVCSLLAH